MINRFKQLREEYNEQLKDKNPKAKLYSVEDMCEEMKDAGFTVSKAKIKKIESEQPDVSIDAKTLLAYKWKFGVSIDWLIDNTVQTRRVEGNIASASKVIGLSDVAIEEISKLKPDYKMILDKMISNYCFLLVLPEIRNLLGYNSLKPHIKLLFDEKTYVKGAEIDQLLYDAVNDNAVAAFFNEIVIKRIKESIDNTMLDKDLQKYFEEKDKNSKIRSVPLSAAYLPKLNPETGTLE